MADELSQRLNRLFLRDPQTGHRACFGPATCCKTTPISATTYSFNEYFNGDTGEGLGASHQTGWTGLVAKLLLPRYAIESHYESRK
ncbi:MAG: hypothetical protein WKG07_32125 [Hymenobacter sp.]